ncbi:TonB-linked outer membrane protein, SusC/RagA family [Mariniphaga anaerophila]|uniref:TonB-linked outer membrane protein, SusC/RagA family n=1 Tax=Mariniphaga anaerophila TaxID=1484053 RepID=A0A1M4Y868_9BACT|nr:TonB-dependent receptor [Mariniphaga anaerophila]SHF01642.1 TonB-linked outer membrane protein, SusC/RagA family [Mariniphaga anaerophila]
MKNQTKYAEIRRQFEKLLLKMKLTLTVLLFCLAGVSASTYSQNTHLSISLENGNMVELIQQIEEKSEFFFYYQKEELNELEDMTVKFRNATVMEILDEVTKGTQFDYTVIDRYIVVKKKGNDFGDEFAAAQKGNDGLQKSVSGQVVDVEKRPLPGVTIVVKGGIQGTITNSEGEYTIVGISEDDVLVFSFVGMRPKEVPINGQTRINVIMEENVIGLDEVVAVGYGVQKKTNLTGSVSEIKSDQIEMRAANSTAQALQGLASNLNIDVNNTGGSADASMKINIRGLGSLSTSSPYILINGVRASDSELSALNPNDIQNISVLKDAASTAIYGAQAAYGVILIETKKGSTNKEFEISYSNNLRIKKRIFVPDFVNSVKYAEVLNIATKNYSGQVAIGEEQMEKIRAYYEGRIQEQTEADPNNPNQWLGIQSGTSNGWFSGYANSNWWDVIFKDQEFAQKHDISASGGTESIAYHISGSFFNDNGGLKYGDENEYFKRYNFDSYISANITDWLKISNNTRFYQENNSFPATLEGGSRGRLYHDAMRFSPLAPYKTPAVKDDQGNTVVPEQLALLPAWLENNGFNAYNENNLVSTFKAEVNLTKGLVLKGDFSFKKIFYDRTLNYKKWSLLGPDGKPSITYQANNNRILKDIRKTDYISFNVYADYHKSIGEDHNFGLIAGYQQEENNYFMLATSRQNVLSSNLNSLNVAIGDVIGPDNPITSWATLGAFGRLSYNYKEKYLFEFNGRYDGSSKFEEGDRFGFFPSASFGYNVHKENFWKSGVSEFINTFKLRASYGKLGNQNVSSYLYLSSIPIETRLNWVVDGTRPNYSDMPGIVSPDITWETSLTKNLGADLSFLNNRLSASFDIYERQTDNMFGPSGALPAVLGANPPRTNSASLKTTGWEFTVGWREKINDFSYRLNFMLSDNTSKITKYHNPNKVLTTYYEGQVIGEIWGFEVDELFQTETEVEEYLSEVDLSYFGSGWQPGDVKYKDLTDDGKVNIGDNTKDKPGDKRIIGNSSPRYRFSLNGGFTWKNVDVNFLFQGIGKRDYFPSDYATLFWGWNGRGHSNITEPVLDFWSKENPDGYLPIPLDNRSSSGSGKDRYASTRYLQSSSYVRLKSLSIGYTIPQSIVNRVKSVKRMRVYFNGENLLTFTKLWKNFDPELAQVTGDGWIGDSRAYPLASVYGFGVNITF